jgi:hypothetical protein
MMTTICFIGVDKEEPHPSVVENVHALALIDPKYAGRQRTPRIRTSKTYFDILK